MAGTTAIVIALLGVCFVVAAIGLTIAVSGAKVDTAKIRARPDHARP
jgi:hypothetical protein